MARLDLPTDERDLVAAIDAEMIPAEAEANVHSTMCKMVDAYLSGVRNMKVLDRWTGHLAIAFENTKGQLEFRYEEIVQLYLAQVGRYLKMDISPTSVKEGESLDALRKAAIGHATLGSLHSKLQQPKLHRQNVIPFLKYGTVGLNHIETGNPRRPDLIETISPRQLRGFPAWVDGVENLYAIARKRWVPYGWVKKRLKDLYNRNMPRKNLEGLLRARDVPWGTPPPEQSSYRNAGQVTGQTWTVSKKDLIGIDITGERGLKPDEGGLVKDGRFYVPLEEVYVYDDSGEMLSRFIVKIGEKVFVDEDYEKQGIEVTCPLHVARHTDTGRMFARGFVAPLMPMNDQIEKMQQALFKNIQEMDAFGTLFITGAMGVDLKRWKTGKRPKVEKYEPDPLNPNLEPKNLTPANSGLLPARVAEFAQGQMERLAGQGPIFRGETSGRVDSAAGLGFLFNTVNIPLGLPVNGLADAYAGVYRRMLQAAKERMMPGQTVEIATVDDAIAGVIIDPVSGRMELAQNPIPNPWDIKVDVRDRTPRDRDVRKQELLELFGAGLVPADRFWITVYEENLDVPGAPKEIWESWRKAVWQIILLFRDGQTPGTVDIGAHTQNPDVQLVALQRFMSKIEFSLASAEVRKAFEVWKTDLEIMAGQKFPVGLPPPEVVAQMQQAGGQRRPPVPGAGIPEGMAPGMGVTMA